MKKWKKKREGIVRKRKREYKLYGIYCDSCIRLRGHVVTALAFRY